MPLNDIIFVKGQGGLGRPLTGEDHISGIIFYKVALPSGFVDFPAKVVYSVSDAEALGIVADCSDANGAVSTLVVDTIGSNGDKVTIKVNEPQGKVSTLAVYTKVSTDGDANAVATSIVALINAGTRTHGYTAVVDGSGIIITAPKKLGKYLNGSSCVITNVGTINVITDSAFSAGDFSQLALAHYHISEFFRMQPKGVLWIYIATDNPTDYSELGFLQQIADGKIRQCAIYKRDSSSSSSALAIQAICDTLDSVHKPLSSVVVGYDISDTSLEALEDLSALNAPKVSAVIGQDLGGLGGYLFDTTQKSVTCVGAVLGTIAAATVSQDIAWKGKFNLSNGVELDTIGFANGEPAIYVSSSLTDTLCDKRYIFVVKNVGSTGTFINDSYTSVAPTSDYCFIENNRTIDKAIRGVYASLLPEIGAPIQLNADGTISDVTINHLKSVAAPNLDQMVRDSDLSNYSVDINPTQDVLATSKIIVSVNLLPKGVSRVIQVNIGFVTSI